MDKGNYVVKLKGNPWASEDGEGMEARRFLLQTIRSFQVSNRSKSNQSSGLIVSFHIIQDYGYMPYTTANLKGTADSIFFVHHPDGNGSASFSSVFFGIISAHSYNIFRLMEKSEFCMLSLNQMDRLRLIDCPEEFQPLIRYVCYSI